MEKVIQECTKFGLKEVIPSTMGEPLLYGGFTDLLNLLKKYKLKLNLTTNGTFPKLGAIEWAKRILPNASDVKISINGASKIMNESIMQGINFNREISNIKDFIKIRDEIRKNSNIHPTITFQATFMNKNMHDLPNLLSLAIELDVDRFKGHHIWITHPELEIEDIRNNKRSIIKWNEIVKELFSIASKYKLKNGKRIQLENFHIILDSNGSKGVPEHYVCPFLGREAWIAWDGTFNVCCAPNDLRKSFGYFGNVKRTAFMKLWKSLDYTNLIENWGSYDICKRCNMRRPIKQPEMCVNA